VIRYETWLRPEALRWPMWIDDQWQRIEAGLDAFESKIGTCSATPQIDEIALGALLSYLDFRFPDHPWAPRRPALQQFQESISQRASFRATIPVAPSGGTLSAVPRHR